MQKEINDYFQRNRGLYDLFPMLVTIVKLVKDSVNNDHNKFLKNNAKVKKTAKGQTTYTIPGDLISRHMRFVEQINSYALTHDIVPENAIVALVSQFDVFVSRAIRYIYSKRPEMLNAIQRNITYAEITALGEIGKIKEFLIEKEIETVLRSSHHSQVEWFQKTLDTNLHADNFLISDFVEITQRRNLFVHSDGIVNQQYISVCKEHNNECLGVKPGDKLKVDQKYFNHAADRLMEIGCKLGQIIWRKIDPAERSLANDSLIETSYNLISISRFTAAINILRFFVENRDKLIRDDTKEYMAIINLAQSYKWAGKQTECLKVLEKENWESKSDNFLLASLVLKDDFIAASNVMKKIGENRHGISKNAYHDWPIFKVFRKSDHFLTAYKDIYGEEYSELEKTIVKRADKK